MKIVARVWAKPATCTAFVVGAFCSLVATHLETGNPRSIVRPIDGMPNHSYRCAWHPEETNDLGGQFGPLAIELWQGLPKAGKRLSRAVLKDGAYGLGSCVTIRPAKRRASHAVVISNDMKCEYWVVEARGKDLHVLMHHLVNGQIRVGEHLGVGLIEEPWSLGEARDYGILPDSLRRRLRNVKENRMVYRYWRYDSRSKRYVSDCKLERLALSMSPKPPTDGGSRNKKKP